MKLSKENFNKSDFHVKDSEGRIHSGVRHSYESGNKLYDVETNHEGKRYSTNMKPSEKHKIHEEIEKHYSIKEHERPYWEGKKK